MPRLLLVSAARELAQQTPVSRDRVIDLVRAFSLSIVVIGHLFMGIPYWQSDVPLLGNLLAHSIYLQALTWPLQVMPLFFLAGGAANAISWRHSKQRDSYRVWAWQRTLRLVTPVFFYLAVMVPIGIWAEGAIGPESARLELALATQLLWFLGVYLVVTISTPVIERIHNRFGWYSVFGYLAIAASLDFLTLTEISPGLGLLNYLVVWAMTAQLGMLYLDRPRNPRRATVGLTLALATAAILVAIGPYPISLVGMPGDDFSNMVPPSIILALQAIAWSCLVELTRPALTRLAARTTAWWLTVQVNAAAMTVYLWHLPVIVGATALLHALNLDRPVILNEYGLVVPGPNFWIASIPYWFGVLVFFVLLVQLIWGFEQLRIPGLGVAHSNHPSRIGNIASITGGTLAGIGLLLIAGSGLGGFPNNHVIYSGIGWTSGQAVGLFLLGLILQRAAASR